ncbi:MAG: protein kinase, partial [Gemmatimonadota bacterium]
PGDWDALSPLLDQLLDAPPGERSQLLMALASGDSARQDALELLLAACEGALPLLDRPAAERFDELLGDVSEQPLPAVFGGRYVLEREVGRGGMARVYLARDLKHDRPVAVKVVRPELAASLGSERFLGEIRIVSRLRHPSIMPLFDSGDADGALYFVMPFEDGLSLRARLDRDGRLGIADALSILRDVARALAHAHDQGIVHRDVKPDNVLLSGDVAVVADFGIATAFNRAGDHTGTRAEAVIGTPAYMAPEQARGDPATDHRADLYSFGSLAYEVFTGSPPAASIPLNATGRSLLAIRPDVPPEVAALIARCLEGDAAARPQRASELLDVLGTAISTSRGPSHRSVLLLASTAVVLLAVLALTMYRTRSSGPVTVAVLPIASESGDSTQVALAQGFSDDVATALVRIPWLRVMSRQGTANYIGKAAIDTKAAGLALGARYLVTGSLRHVEGELALTARLLRSDDGAEVWAGTFVHPTELALLRDQVVSTIADSLRSVAGAFSNAQVGPDPKRRGNGDAYRLYLLGTRELNQRTQNLAASVAHFRQSLALDSLSADAWAGLSLALAISPIYQGGLSSSSVTPEVVASARRALHIDPTLAAPHIALGAVYGRTQQWADAEQEFKAALEIDPHDVEARAQYGSLFLGLNRVEDGLRQYQQARDDDPASGVVLGLLTKAWYLSGRMDSALAESNRAMQGQPTLTTLRFRALTLASLGNHKEALQLVDTLRPGLPLVLYAMALAGDTAGARARLQPLLRKNPKGWLEESSIAFAFLGLGDTAQALSALERAADRNEPWSFALSAGGPVFDDIRESPRFRRVLERTGLFVK